MTSSDQERYWSQSPHYSRPGQWTKPYFQNHNYEQDPFVTIRRSRKGTRLNIPTTDPYVLTRQSLSYIESIPVLRTKQCCDMRYVLHRQTEDSWIPRGQLYEMKNWRSNPSVTINIGTSARMNAQQRMSFSTLSINPTVVSEETQKTVIPLGLHCCGSRAVCEHSRPEEAAKTNSVNRSEDDKFVYMTTAPRISPLRSCWKFLVCTKKKKQGDVYLPAAMTKTEPPKQSIDCPNCSKNHLKPNERDTQSDQINSVPSRLSAIMGSEMTVSEYSSEEFVFPVRKGEQLNKFKQLHGVDTYPQRLATDNRQLMARSELGLDTNRNEILPAPQCRPDGPIYWWVCKPVKTKKDKKSLKNGRKHYTCYRDTWHA